jgi:hypothetical protein
MQHDFKVHKESVDLKGQPYELETGMWAPPGRRLSAFALGQHGAHGERNRREKIGRRP